MPSSTNRGASGLVAVLGPTNTGKTHHAIERMLEHASGMIGLPLRLLAREVYDRVCRRVGAELVALQTGEEKLIPARPRYWVCTVEAMPIDLEVDFVAVDEIQLAGHPQRGHVFCDRLLHVRGRSETWFLGSDAAQVQMQRLLPLLEVVRHPRLSTLRYAGASSLSGLEPRSGVVAFSTSEVYSLAERVRQRHGGVAVVMGALSPRTRNAQVEMYESGEVDYLVATDAIGMGLNLNVRHIAFAGLHKYDGQVRRALQIGEIAQIAGRAGRHLEDGTFGTLLPLEGIDEDLVYDLEHHRVPEISRFYWRSRELDFDSPAKLIATLRERPPAKNLVGIDGADDYDALCELAGRESIRRRATTAARVELLWEVCQIPDYRKLLTGQHVDLLEAVFAQLCDFNGKLRDEWVEQMVGPIDDTVGSIDLLTARIGAIRTWTYIGYRNNWLEDPIYWQERAREIEDRLSDALHEALIARFVARQRTSSSVAQPWRRTARRGQAARQLGSAPETAVKGRNVEGDFAGFSALVKLAYGHALPGIADDDPSQEIASAQDAEFSLEAGGEIYWSHPRSQARCLVGKMVRGQRVCQPNVVWAGEASWEFDSLSRSEITKRLTKYCREMVATRLFLGPHEREELRSPAAKGIVYQLDEALGTVDIRRCRRQLGGLSREERAWFRNRGLTLGRYFLDIAENHCGLAASLRRQLVATFLGGPTPVLDGVAHWPEQSGTDASDDQRDVMQYWHETLGYFQVQRDAFIRVDIFERVVQILAQHHPSKEAATQALLLACPELQSTTALHLLQLCRRFGPSKR